MLKVGGLFLFIFFATPCLAGQKLTIINEQIVVESALGHYPKIYASEEGVRGAESNLIKARGNFDTKLESKYNEFTSGGYTNKGFSQTQVVKPLPLANAKVYGGYSSSLNAGQDPERLPYNNTKSGGRSILGFEVSLLRGFLINEQNTQVKTAGLDVKISKLANTLLQKQVTIDAKKSFWRFVYTTKILQAYEDLLDIAIKRNDALAKQVKAGDKAEIVLAENKRAVLRRQSQLETARRDWLNAAVSLSMYLRDETGEMHQLEDITTAKLEYTEPQISPPLNYKEHIKTATEKRIDVRINQIFLEQNNLELKLAKNEILPVVDVGFESWQDYGNGPQVKDQRSDKVKINVSIPLENKKQQGNYKKAEAEAKKTRYNLTLLQNEIANDIAKVYNKLKEYHIITTNSAEEVEIVKRLAKAEQVRFYNGDSDFFMLNARENDVVLTQEYLFKSRLAMMEHNFDYNFATNDTILWD